MTKFSRYINGIVHNIQIVDNPLENRVQVTNEKGQKNTFCLLGDIHRDEYYVYADLIEGELIKGRVDMFN